MIRAGVESQIRAVDELRSIANCARPIGQQTRKKGGKGKHNTEVVCVFAGKDSCGQNWNLFVRGKVLLTIHGPY